MSRSPSRSTSPQKKIRVDFVDTGCTKEDIHPLCQEQFLNEEPSRSNSPEKCRSPSRKIEARLAPRILDNVTHFVDSQIQNLEIRMAQMETSFENWRQATIPDGAVEGMCSSDLHMLTGMNIVESRPDDLHLLVDPAAEAAWNAPTCSTSLPTQQGSVSTDKSSRSS